MIEAPLPANEANRLATLRAYEILDTDPEDTFDDLTKVAARICGTPIALVSLIDEHRQWFKSRIGLDATETPRSVAFCSHAILEPDEVMIVPDATRDARFSDNPLVVADPNVIFYAGAPLVTPDGIPLGTLCIIDHVPRDLDDESRETLQSLARATISQLELRKAALDLRDLSQELARSNQDLARRNGEIRRFYQTLSHELKTPVTVVREYVSMVLEGLAGEIAEEQRRFLTIAMESCDRMAADVDDLLDLTRIETGKLRLEAGPVSVQALLESAVTALAPFATKAGVRLDYAPGEELPTVLADKGKVIQVLSNLIRNAIKFTPPGGEIDVAARRVDDPEDFVEISVRDTGRGIKADDLENVFERLYQCTDDDACSKQGLGLGLYLCREIVKLHGGEILAESVEGAGTTFRFSLPPHAIRVARTERPVLEEVVT